MYMTKPILLAVLLALSAGCTREPEPADPAAGSEAETFIGRQAAKAIAEASSRLETENITLGGNHHIRLGDKAFMSTKSADGLPKAEITPEGDLLIAGEAVAITPEQREQLLAHRGHLVAIARAGMEIGTQGADIAGKALTGIGEAIFGGESGREAYEQRIEAEAEKIKRGAHRRLCALLPALLDSQQALAGSLPAFAPYARMTTADIDDCTKDLEQEPATGDGGDLVEA